MQNEHITSPTAAIKIILGGCNPASFKTKEILTKLAEDFPHIQTHYRFVFNTLKRLAQSYAKVQPTDPTLLASEVLEYATEHYANGWDVVVETMTHAEVKAQLIEAGIKTIDKAIAHFGELVQMHSERQQEVLAEAF